jgi:hypothetical protein
MISKLRPPVKCDHYCIVLMAVLSISLQFFTGLKEFADESFLESPDDDELFLRRCLESRLASLKSEIEKNCNKDSIVKHSVVSNNIFSPEWSFYYKYQISKYKVGKSRVWQFVISLQFKFKQMSSMNVQNVVIKVISKVPFAVRDLRMLWKKISWMNKSCF